MKKILAILFLGFMLAGFSSCLKRNLDPLPAYSDKKIDRFDFEYRWNSNGTFKVVRMNTTTTTISDGSLDVKITVPAVSSSFPQTERDKVSLSNLVGMCNISTAATIEPVEGSPQLGVPADFSKGSVKYKVTAADGSTKIWTANVHL